MTDLLEISKLRRDAGTQPRAGLNDDVVLNYAEQFELGCAFPPVDVVFTGTDYILWDGYHRAAGAELAGMTKINAAVMPGTVEDAQWKSYGANRTNGLYRSTADKQRAVRAALAHSKGAGLSDRLIAEHIGVDMKTVSRIRAELESTAEIPQLSIRTGRDGRTRNVSKIGGKPSTREIPELKAESTAEIPQLNPEPTPPTPSLGDPEADLPAGIQKPAHADPLPPTLDDAPAASDGPQFDDTPPFLRPVRGDRIDAVVFGFLRNLEKLTIHEQEQAVALLFGAEEIRDLLPGTFFEAVVFRAKAEALEAQVAELEATTAALRESAGFFERLQARAAEPFDPARDSDYDGTNDTSPLACAHAHARTPSVTNELNSTKGKKERGAKKTKGYIPKDWELTPELLAWAAEKFPHIDAVREADKFKDNYASRKTDYTDWNATFRNWIRKADEFLAARGGPAKSKLRAVPPPPPPTDSEAATGPMDDALELEYLDWCEAEGGRRLAGLSANERTRLVKAERAAMFAGPKADIYGRWNNEVLDEHAARTVARRIGGDNKSYEQFARERRRSA